MTISRLILFAVSSATVAWSQTTVPTSVLYLTNGDLHRLTIITGSSYVQAAQGQSSFREYPIAVGQQIVTSGSTFNEQPGGVYALNGTFQQAAGSWALNSGQTFWDGTTDGLFNYAVDYSNGGVYRFGTDWSGGTLLFNYGASGDYLGITYDATDKTLWLSGWNSNTVAHVSMTGTLLGSFTAGVFSGSLAALALDPADSTLWMGSQGQSGILAQYSKTGVLLGTHTYGFTDNILGGEFAFVSIPEPGVVELLGLGLALLLATRARRHRA